MFDAFPLQGNNTFELLPSRRLAISLNGAFGDMKGAAGKVGAEESAHCFEVIRIVFELEMWRLRVPDNDGMQTIAAGE